jgi:hypothetical protein
MQTKRTKRLDLEREMNSWECLPWVECVGRAHALAERHGLPVYIRETRIEHYTGPLTGYRCSAHIGDAVASITMDGPFAVVRMFRAT